MYLEMKNINKKMAVEKKRNKNNMYKKTSEKITVKQHV